MKHFISKVVLISMFVCGSAMADTDSQPLLSFPDFLAGNLVPIPEGMSYLTRTDDGMILVTVEVTGLVPGDAVTLWALILNDPTESDPDCVDLDGNADPSCSTLSNASGNVVKSDGTLEFGAILHEDMTEPGHQVIFANTVGGELLTDADTAGVILVVQIHGQARGGKKLREQISQLEANCTPSCADVQVALHFP
jgi:hypothetical protein